MEVEIAGEFKWGHDEIFDLPAVWAFHMAMQAKRLRYQRLEDQRTAATFAHYPERTQRSLLGMHDYMLSGPGKVVRLQEVVSDIVREGMAACQAEVDAQIERYSRQGILCGPDGSKPVTAFLKRGDEPANGFGTRPGMKN